jgi:hypothetical protein
LLRGWRGRSRSCWSWRRCSCLKSPPAGCARA